eukprot:SM000124S25914  [mRNA]  locus=s124:26165:27669:- [translate_table: standard]
MLLRLAAVLPPQSLPDALGGLAHLARLNLRGNKLRELPDALGLLGRLRVLDVSNNYIAHLPKTLLACRALEELDASFNDLVALPEELGSALGNLRRLSVHLNRLRYLPATIGKATALQRLDVHFNRLQVIDAGVGQLRALTHLNASNNFADLTELPASLADLYALVELDVSNNQIHELPVEFGRLALGGKVKLILGGNPWVDPPQELVASGNQAALHQYLVDRWQAHLDQLRKRTAWSSSWLGSWYLLRWLAALMGNWSQLVIAQGRSQTQLAGSIRKRHLEDAKIEDLPAESSV